MQGQVLKFRSDIGVGVIQGVVPEARLRHDDGRSYRFTRTEILNADVTAALVGRDVDFVIEALNPRAIIFNSGSPWTALGSANRA